MTDMPHPDLWNDFITSVNADHIQSENVAKMLLKESDRGCAIFGASILDDELEFLLRAYFRDDPKAVKDTINSLFNGEAPLATFSSRIKLAFALNLITRTMQSRIDIIRKLRNDFAHESGPLDFNDPRCRDRYNVLVTEWKDLLPKQENPSTEELSKRVGFILAVSKLAGQIRTMKEFIKRLEDVQNFKALILQLEQEGM
jgi:DNA-binding MltR family transcriptional regulator